MPATRRKPNSRRTTSTPRPRRAPTPNYTRIPSNPGRFYYAFYKLKLDHDNNRAGEEISIEGIIRSIAKDSKEYGVPAGPRYAAACRRIMTSLRADFLIDYPRRSHDRSDPTEIVPTEEFWATMREARQIIDPLTDDLTPAEFYRAACDWLRRSFAPAHSNKITDSDLKFWHQQQDLMERMEVETSLQLAPSSDDITSHQDQASRSMEVDHHDPLVERPRANPAAGAIPGPSTPLRRTGSLNNPHAYPSPEPTPQNANGGRSRSPTPFPSPFLDNSLDNFLTPPESLSRPGEDDSMDIEDDDEHDTSALFTLLDGPSASVDAVMHVNSVNALANCSGCAAKDTEMSELRAEKSKLGECLDLHMGLWTDERLWDYPGFRMIMRPLEDSGFAWIRDCIRPQRLSFMKRTLEEFGIPPAPSGSQGSSTS